MTKRDDFSASIKRALALRAGRVCSMSECGQSTSGPSEETPQSFSIIGVAAHISAAAPGGPRYDSRLTAAERQSIENGIWLCANCASVIDRDVTTFMVEALKEMKRRHEADRRFGPKGRAPGALDDLVALGPSLICTGELTGAGAEGADIVIKHFLTGEPALLFAFVNGFDALAPEDRYILINELGEGYPLQAAPTLERAGEGYRLKVPLAPRAARQSVHSIGSMLAQDAVGDLLLMDGDMACVSGLGAFSQLLTNLLGLAKAEAVFHPTAGSRIAEFVHDFSGSAWLASLFKLEIIRLASIPDATTNYNASRTPLLCVERVTSVRIATMAMEDQRLVIRVAADLCGEGRWEGDVRVFVHTAEQLQNIGILPERLTAVTS